MGRGQGGDAGDGQLCIERSSVGEYAVVKSGVRGVVEGGGGVVGAGGDGAEADERAGYFRETLEKSSEPLSGVAQRERREIAKELLNGLLGGMCFVSIIDGGGIFVSGSRRPPPARGQRRCPSAVWGRRSSSVPGMHSENVRMVASMLADSGMMLRLVPAWRTPTVRTTGSNTLNWRVIMTCRAVTISAAAVTGSLAECGAEPWPPAPRTVTVSASDALSITPDLVQNRPWGSRAENTCMP